MRSSTMLALLGAALAVASPLHNFLHKKDIVWDYVTDIVTVTITEGEAPAAASTPDPAPIVNAIETSTTPTVVVPTTTSTPAPATTQAPPAPAPTTTQAPATTQAVAPAQEAAVFAASPSSSSSAPVVEAPASSSSVAASTPTDFASTGLYHHNTHRSNHSASALTWDDTLAGYAQQLADTCVYHHDQTIGGGGYSQNIDATAMGGTNQENLVPAWDPNQVLANAITNDWYYPEVALFDQLGLFGQPSVPVPADGAPDYLHFPQIVWHGTSRVGCAVKYCGTQIPLGGDYVWYTVCNYAATGNVEGEFDTNVPRPEGQASLNTPTPWGGQGYAS